MITSEQIITQAQSMLNVPYAHYGRSRIGVDCSGLIYIILNRLGKDIPMTDGNTYTPLWWRNGDPTERMINYFEEIGFITTDEPIIGGIITFRLFSKTCPANHSGIIINEKQFIHPKCGRIRKENKVTIDFIEPSYIKRLHSYMVYKECK